jgi:hypothetical protein
MSQGEAGLGSPVYAINDCKNAHVLQLKVRRSGNPSRGRNIVRCKFGHAVATVLVPRGGKRLVPRKMRPRGRGPGNLFCWPKAQHRRADSLTRRVLVIRA